MSWRKITITDGTTILRTMTVKDEYVAIQASGNEVIHEEHYPSNLYDFDGDAKFTHKATVEPPHLLATSLRNIISVMLKQMKQQGSPLPMHDEQVLSKDAAKRLIDLAFSRACEKYVSAGKYMTFIYTRKEDAVRAWRQGGSVESEAPELLKSWLDNSTFTTLDAAATDIIQQADYVYQKAEAAERIRLEARSAILAASSNFEIVIQPFLVDLENV